VKFYWHPAARCQPDINFASPSSLTLRRIQLLSLNVFVEAMSPASIFRQLKNLGRNRGAGDSGESIKEQDGRSKDGAVSPVLPVTPSKGMSRLSWMPRSFQSSQSSQAPANVGFRPPEQATPSTTEPAPPCQQLATTIVSPPPAPAAQKSTDTVSAASQGLPERLWNEAYDELKQNEGELTEAYERILSSELKGGNSSSVASLEENAVEQNLIRRWSQMEQLV
jgi:hypothetical protein